MFQITDSQMVAIEAEMTGRQRRAFVAWIRRHQALIGTLPPDDRLGGTFDLALPEAAQAGIDTDDRLFTYACARGLMPAMTGAQYLLALDIVFSPMGDEDRIAALVALRDQRGG